VNGFIISDEENAGSRLEYFELLCPAEILEVMARETDCYAQRSLENAHILKLKI
jgi:hypothetical protein